MPATTRSPISPRDSGARFIHDSVAEVRARTRRSSAARAARDVAYDHLVVAVGAKTVPAFPHALTFGDDPAERAAARPARRPRAGLPPQRRVRRPARGGVDAPALRARADDRAPGLEHGHGPDPLHARDARGPPAGDVRDAGERGRRRAALRPRASSSSAPRIRASARLRDRRPRRPADRRRPRRRPAGLEGRRLNGVPCGRRRFHPGRRPRSCDAAWPASTRRATAPTSRSSRAASPPSRPTPWPRRSRPRPGADVEPEPFRPVLRGMLLTGGDDRFFRHTVAGGGGEGEAAGHTLWWPPTKIAGRYLSGYLFERDEDRDRRGDPRRAHRDRAPARCACRPPGTPSAAYALPAPEVCEQLEVDARHRPRRSRGRAAARPQRPQPAAHRAGAVAARARRPPVRQLDGAPAGRRGGDLARHRRVARRRRDPRHRRRQRGLRRGPGGAGRRGRRRGARPARAHRPSPARGARARAARRDRGAGRRRRPRRGRPRPGRRAPRRSTLLQIDESALTGESLARSKRADPPDPRGRAARRAAHHRARRHDRRPEGPGASS